MQSLRLNSLRIPTEKEMAAAIESLNALAPLLSARTEIQQVTLIGEGGERVSLRVPTSALRLLGQTLGEIAVGHAVRAVPVRAELTSQEAADLLDVSRPYLIKLLDQGEMPHTKAGRHRRVKLTDLLSYKERRDAANYAALEAVAAQAQKLGIGYE
ncbi:TPA: helix-turn-helix domain-containing protein [Pseudomonas aeruginosa]|nr:excisionase family DNA-binding protein [Pseudomonas aeruginosa]HBP6530856.1 helix-turn-helix domain-containing protein [Pseudomonas aeruginosa]